MNKKLLVLLVMGLLTVYVVSADSAVGTWKGTGSLDGVSLTTTTMSYVFKADGTFTVTLETRAFGIRATTDTYSGTWTQSGNTVTIRNTTTEVTDSATIDGNTMSVPIRVGPGGRITGYFDLTRV
jgi:hypothetical protein